MRLLQEPAGVAQSQDESRDNSEPIVNSDTLACAVDEDGVRDVAPAIENESEARDPYKPVSMGFGWHVEQKGGLLSPLSNACPECEMPACPLGLRGTEVPALPSAPARARSGFRTFSYLDRFLRFKLS